MILTDEYDAFLLDLDGVIWRGEEPISKADQAVAALRAAGKRVIFVTNNSSRTPREYAVKLARMKIPTPNDEIVTSGHVVVEELRAMGVETSDRIHVCGGEGLIRLLTHERFVPTGEEDTGVKAVVVGWNPRGTFDDLRKAANLVRGGIPFIASNADATYPSEDGLLPGTGAIVAALQVASGRAARVVGKPEPGIFSLALLRAGVSAQRALFVGDRPETDLVGARAAGIPCALVLTGVTSERDLGRLTVLPNELLESVHDLVRDLPRPRIERAPDGLIAMDGGELARLGVEKVGTTTMLRELRVPAHFEPEATWRVVRRLLVEAVSGAERVEAPTDICEHLDRIGVDGRAQGTLFSS